MRYNSKFHAWSTATLKKPRELFQGSITKNRITLNVHTIENRIVEFLYQLHISYIYFLHSNCLKEKAQNEITKLYCETQATHSWMDVF